MKFVDKLVSLLEIVYNFLTKAKTDIINWFHKVFEVKSTKKAKICAVAVTGVLFASVMFLYRQFVDSAFKSKWYMFSAALILPMVIGLMIAYTVRFRDTRKNKFCKTLSLFLMPFFAMGVSEALNGVFFWDKNKKLQNK